MDGRLAKDSYVWKPGMPQWQIAKNTPEVLRLVALAPPPFTCSCALLRGMAHVGYGNRYRRDPYLH